MPLPEPPPLSLYVHLPWCIKKCPYCDFNSHEFSGKPDTDRYIDSLILDLEHSLASGSPDNHKLVSIFFGGGTPSLFTGPQLKRIIQQAREWIGFLPDTEITMEANPGSVEHDAFEHYLDAGINRLSLGVQSFDDHNLGRLGRIHDSVSAANAITAARVAGFENLNLDLMYGLPGQDTTGASADCSRALEFNPTHLSLYQLTIEPNTRFYLNPPTLPGESESMDIQASLVDLLGSAGFERYEVSAYGLPGYASRHNLNYWEFGDYLGIGAGAHSKMTRDGRIFRSARRKNPHTWMDSIRDGKSHVTTNEVTGKDILFEYMLNGLRIRDGISLDDFSQRTGLSRKVACNALERALAAGLVSIEGTRLACTDRGYLLIDEILQDLLPDTKS